ncbi:MAG: lipoyl protein ligase domain-containing protein [Candidatus Omnitrophota bacterium]
MPDWRLLSTISAEIPFQFALDELLFNTDLRTPVLRFYFASQPCISIGHMTDIRPIKEKARRSVYRRLTGGGIVEHGKDLIFSIAARKEHDPSFASVRESYRKIHEGVRRGLQRAGIDAAFFTGKEDPAGLECFRAPVLDDLYAAGRKVVGGAQKRSAGRLLHQGSIQISRRSGCRDLPGAIVQGLAEVFGRALQPADWEPERFFTAERNAMTQYPDLRGVP